MNGGPAAVGFAEWWPILPVGAAAAIVSALVIRLIRPHLLKHALARPNARSSHRIPTPQGAGIAVVAATLVVAGFVLGGLAPVELFGAALFIAALGFADDIKPVPVLPRLLLQAIAVGAVVFASPAELRIASVVPFWVERGLLVLAGLWFVNLVNFMDGLDWMTVAEVVPVTAALAILGAQGDLPLPAVIVAAALCGAMIGFAPFNRPVASIFLGDVGSLPIGLVVGWSLLQLAFQHHLAAALLLPLYYLGDATVTLLRRMMRREPFWVAHRSHFYQRATDNGFSVMHVVSEVFVLNVALALLAAASIHAGSPAADAALVAAGAAAVALVMLHLSRSAKAFSSEGDTASREENASK
jgi:UDP-N-acetylmuramyl pentapeptide phosphotransferase/UDP-N-acetylglucosamine-1-phosphate transferase